MVLQSIAGLTPRFQRYVCSLSIKRLVACSCAHTSGRHQLLAVCAPPTPWLQSQFKVPVNLILDCLVCASIAKDHWHLPTCLQPVFKASWIGCQRAHGHGLHEEGCPSPPCFLMLTSRGTAQCSKRQCLLCSPAHTEPCLCCIGVLRSHNTPDNQRDRMCACTLKGSTTPHFIRWAPFSNRPE